jgi:hypothetical protein
MGLHSGEKHSVSYSKELPFTAYQPASEQGLGLLGIRLWSLFVEVRQELVLGRRIALRVALQSHSGGHCTGRSYVYPAIRL